MDDAKELEERFREAASIGDKAALGQMLKQGVDIDAINHMNGWTALHWACKRGHAPSVQFLLSRGADKTVTNTKDEVAGQLTDRLDIHTLLGGAPNKLANSSSSEALPITPNYITNPPFPYTSKPNGGRSPAGSSSSSRSNRDLHASINHQQVPTPHRNHHHQPAGTMIAANLSPQEIVLKVRVANAPDTDFIEIELDRSQLTFINLLQTCCRELQVEPTSVIKIRKLPNTMLRKDKDVTRLVDLQELEIVVKRAPHSTVGNYQVPNLELVY